MGKCVQCEEFLPPHFMVDIDDDVQKCAFCHLDRAEVTTVNDETKQEEKITKKEAAKRYRIFLKRLQENPKVAEVLSKAKGAPYLKGNA